MPAWLTIVTSLAPVMQMLLAEIESLVKQIDPAAGGQPTPAANAKLAAMMQAHAAMATNSAAIVAANMPS